MAKKTDKTASDQSDAEKDIIDAEIVEEIPAQQADAVPDTSEEKDAGEPVVMEEPEPSETEHPETADPDEASVDPVTDVAQDQDAPSEALDEDSKIEQADAEPQQAVAPVVEKRIGFFPVFLGGVAAAAIGFGAAIYVFPDGLPLSGEASVFEVETAEALRSQASELAALKAQLSEAANRDDLNKAIADLSADLTTARADLDSLGVTIGGFDARIGELEKRPLTGAVSPAAIAAYEREVKSLQESVAAQRAEAETMEGNARLSAQQALGRSALTRVVSALDSGVPFRAALVDLTSAFGIAAPTALELLADDGVPTLSQLEDAYPLAAREALAVARKANRDADGGSRLGTFLKNQLGARSVAPREGADPDAILSRSEAALREGRLNDALIELKTLPEIAAAEMADWAALAQTRADALQAAETLAQSLNSN